MFLILYQNYTLSFFFFNPKYVLFNNKYLLPQLQTRISAFSPQTTIFFARRIYTFKETFLSLLYKKFETTPFYQLYKAQLPVHENQSQPVALLY